MGFPPPVLHPKAQPAVAGLALMGAPSGGNTQSWKLPKLKYIGKSLGVMAADSPSTAGTDYSGSSRVLYTTKGPISLLKLIVKNIRGSVGVENAGYNSVIQGASVEYPIGTTIGYFTLGGRQRWVLDATCAYAETDLLGIYIPAATQFAVIFHERVPVPPTTLTATASAGGSLTSGLAYYYKVTSIEKGLESGPTAEVTATPSSSNLSVTLAWTGNSSASDYNIYRGTTIGAETFLCKIPAGGTAFVDTGLASLGTGLVPPATQKMIWNHVLQTGENANTQSSGGNGNDQTGTPGSFGTTGPANQFTCKAVALVGDDLSSCPVLCQGDSIGAGVGIPGSGAYSVGNGGIVKNWFDQGFLGASYNTLNGSLGGATINQLITALNGTRLRLKLTDYTDYVVSNLGRNDLAGSRTWQQIAGDHLAMARVLTNRGIRYVLTTLVPITTSTDNFLTIANQTLSSYETNRANYNIWLRNGCQVDGSGNAVSSGGTSQLGTGGLVWAVADIASAIETNASNLLTANGGYWQAYGTALSSGTLSGTQTLTVLAVSGTPFSGSQQIGNVIVMTSGAASGQIGVISSNGIGNMGILANGAAPPSGVGTVKGLTTIPAAGDSYSIYAVPTVDGTHPNLPAYNAMGTYFDNDDPDPPYLKFVDPEHGIRAIAMTLANYAKIHGLHSIAQICARWAPAADRNDPQYYALAVARAVGCSVDDPVDLQNAPVLEAITAAIIIQECGRNDGQNWYDTEMIHRGVGMALQLGE